MSKVKSGEGCDEVVIGSTTGENGGISIAKGGLVRKIVGVILVGVCAVTSLRVVAQRVPAATTAPATTAPVLADEATRASVLAATTAYFEAWIAGDAKRVGQMLDPRNEPERNLAAAQGR